MKEKWYSKVGSAFVKLLAPSRPGYVTVYRPLDLNKEYSTSVGLTEVTNTMEKKEFISFDTSESALIKEITISGIEMQVLLRDHVAKKTSKAMKEQDDDYKDMTLHMKDGTSFDIVKNYQNTDFCYGNCATSGEENRDRSYIFMQAIPFDEIACLEVDGVRFYPE